MKKIKDSYTKELRSYLREVSREVMESSNDVGVNYEEDFFDNSNQYRFLKILDELRAYTKKIAFEPGDSEVLMFPINYLDNGDKIVKVIEYVPEKLEDFQGKPKIFYAFYYPAEKRLDRIIFPIDDDYVEVFIEI